MTDRVWRKSSISGTNGSCVEVSDPRWRKSSYSGSGGSCVEVAMGDRHVWVRDTKDKGDGPVLTFTPAEWDAFIAGCKDGEFDQVTV